VPLGAQPSALHGEDPPHAPISVTFGANHRQGETSLGQRAEAASGQIIAAGERGGYYHEERGEFRAPHPRAHRSVAARGQEGPADEAVRRPGKPGAGQKGSEGIVTDAANPGHLFRRRRWRRS
jgi:hypothetical protein